MAKKKKEPTNLNQWMGRRLAQLRLSAGLTQNEFARQLDVSRMTLINAENGIQTITNWLLFNAAVLIGVHVAEFFPAQDKNGNYITQGEYKELVRKYPADYPKTFKKFRIKSPEEIDNIRKERETQAEQNRLYIIKAKEAREAAKKEKTRLAEIKKQEKAITKANKPVKTKSITRKLILS